MVPSFNRNLSRHQLSRLLALRLLSYVSSRRRKRRRKNGKNIFGYNIHIWCSFTEIFGIQFSFHILSAIKSSKLKVKVRTDFLMYGENTKYHSNPYIQGTTVPCDKNFRTVSSPKKTVMLSRRRWQRKSLERVSGSLPRNTVRQASVAKKKPEAFYLRPLKLPCGFTFGRSARMRIEHARSNTRHTSRLYPARGRCKARSRSPNMMA